MKAILDELEHVYGVPAHLRAAIVRETDRAEQLERDLASVWERKRELDATEIELRATIENLEAQIAELEAERADHQCGVHPRGIA